MRLGRSAKLAILIWAMALTLWLGVGSYRSFAGEASIPKSCCVNEQASSSSSSSSSNSLTFKMKLFTIKGVNVSFMYGLDGNPSRITLDRETCS